MKGIVLCGGTGSRLRPITHNTAKQLVPVGNRPVLEHVIEDLKRAGITEIGLVVGYNFTDQIQESVGNGSRLGVDITYIFQGEPLGLAHAVGCARDFVGDDSFVVYFGDTILDTEITKRLVEAFDPTAHDVGLPLQQVDDPSRFGIVEFDDEGGIRRVLEKPDDPPSDFAYVGVVAFSPLLFDIVEELEPSDRGELELTAAIDQIVRGDGDAAVIEVDGTWKDVGTPEDVIDTNEIVLGDIDSDVRGTVHESATVEGSLALGTGSRIGPDVEVDGPVVVGENTTIEAGTEVGPYVTIEDECVIRAARITSTVVLEEATIDTSRTITDSVIGSKVTLSDADETQTISCLLGRDDKIEL